MTIQNTVLKARFEGTIINVENILSQNLEWVSRFSKYADSILGNTANIKQVLTLFHEWEPLKLYLNTTNAVSAKHKVSFDLRFLGQAVALIHYRMTNNQTKLVLSTDKYYKHNNKFFGYDLIPEEMEWTDKKASAFRYYFKELSVKKTKNKGNEEHRIESLSLTEMLKRTNKALPKVRPITNKG